MSTGTPNNKKPAGAGRGNPSSSTTTGPASRSPSRMTASSQASGTASTTSNGVNRTRSVRNGAPVSARAAAARKQTQTPDPAEEDAKAEMQAKMEELQQKLQQAEQACEESQKHAAVLQVKLDEAVKEQGLLEERVHEHTEQIEDLENDKKESLRARREMEQIYESERAAAMKEKEEVAAREEEMQQAMQRMKETLAQREMRAGLDDERRPNLSRQSSHGRSSNPSPNPDVSDRQFAPSSVQRSDSSSRQNSKLLMQKDKVIESLRLELAEAQIKLVEVENMGGGHMQQLQNQLYETKMQNARLMEENESFQLLLSEKTLNGDFSNFLRPPSNNNSRPPSREPDAPEGRTGGTTLADELESHGDEEGGEEHKRLQAEANSLKDQNRALTLYINNIISRLLQHEQFEQILDKTPDLMAGPGAASRRYEADKDKDLPPPPPEKDEQPSLLQRAKSVMGGKPKARPTSQTINPEQLEAQPRASMSNEPSKHEDPQTAPRVPIGRSASTRVGGHRRANSEWPAASVVTNMYRGPQQSMGPLSPGLTSPTGRNSFFGGNMRAPSSGSNVPTISETNVDKDNEQRDSKIGSSQRNSVISSTADGIEHVDSATESGLASERSNPSSPPRSTTSSGDKDKPSGAIMMGSKPRPLRLVQEAKDENASKNAANRGSWYGWMNKGLGGAGGVFGNKTNSDQPPAQ